MYHEINNFKKCSVGKVNEIITIIEKDTFYRSILRYASFIMFKYKINGKWVGPASTFSAYTPEDLVSIVYEEVILQLKKKPEEWISINEEEVSKRFKNLVNLRMKDEYRKLKAKKITRDEFVQKSDNKKTFEHIDELKDDLIKQNPLKEQFEEFKNRRIDADHISNEIGEFKKGGDVFFNYGYGSDLVEQFYITLIDITKLLLNPRVSSVCKNFFEFKMAGYTDKDIAEEYNMSVGTAHSRWSECRKLFYILLKGKNK